MLEKAKITDSFELSDEGVSFDEALETLIHSINNEANLTFLGEIAINFQIKQHLKNRELISRKYKTLKTEKVSPPIIVIGLPRSGTTFLFNLLSKDKKFRSPLFWEMLNPLPLVKNGSYKEKVRIIKSEGILFFKELYIPKLDDIHNINSHSPEECLLIKVLSLQSILYYYMANTPTYLDYLAEANKRESYLWHHKFLRVLEENGKPERWLLKDPSHLGNLEEILGVYPDACFIDIRRDPSETLPSICSLTKQVRGGFSKNIDLKELGQKTLDFWAKSNEKNEFQKSNLPEDKYMSVEYEDLVEDPMNLIKDIYANFSLEFCEEAQTNMFKYLDKGKDEARIPHKYSLEDYGLSRGEVHNKLNFS